MKIFKKNNFLLICLLTLILPLAIFPNIAFAQSNFDVQAKAAIAVDADSGKIFYQKNANKALPIASMTKLVTLYLVLEAEKNGDLSWDEELTISDHLLKISQDPSLSNVPLNKDQTYSVRDLFNASTLVSANAAVTALAEKIGGTEEAFVDLMREKVSSWGIDDAYLISTSGINNEDAKGRIYPGSKAHEENLMSAKDMVIIARHLLKDFPEILETTKLTSTIFGQGTAEETLITNTNLMLPGMPYGRENIDGLKTGTTELAGECFASTAILNGHRIITIIMHANDNYTDSDTGQRFTQTGDLLDYIDNNWDYKIIYPKNSKVPKVKPLVIENSTERTIPLVTGADIGLWIRSDMKKDDLDLTFKPINNLEAPLSKNKILGNITVGLKNDPLGYLPGSNIQHSYPMVTNHDIEKANLFERVKRSITDFFS